MAPIPPSPNFALHAGYLCSPTLACIIHLHLGFFTLLSNTGIGSL